MQGTVDKDQLVEIVVTNGIPGKYSVHCETNHDDTVLTKQIPEASELAYDLMVGLGEIASTWRDDHRGSAAMCAKRAERELVDDIRSVIDYLSCESLRKIRCEIDETLENREQS